MVIVMIHDHLPASSRRRRPAGISSLAVRAIRDAATAESCEQLLSLGPYQVFFCSYVGVHLLLLADMIRAGHGCLAAGVLCMVVADQLQYIIQETK